MHHGLGLAATFGFIGLLAGGVSGCSSDVQANPVVMVAAHLPAAHSSMPAADASFDAWAITTMETVGATPHD